MSDDEIRSISVLGDDASARHYAGRLRELAVRADGRGDDDAAASYRLRAAVFDADTLDEVREAYEADGLMDLYKQTYDGIRPASGDTTEHGLLLAWKAMLVGVGYKMAREHVTDRMRGKTLR